MLERIVILGAAESDGKVQIGFYRKDNDKPTYHWIPAPDANVWLNSHKSHLRFEYASLTIHSITTCLQFTWEA